MEQRIKILILEHDPYDLDLLQYELQKSQLPYTTAIVQNREDYERALESFNPDIILSDYSLPAFDGLTAFHLKQQVLPEVPFIIVSGTIGDENAVEYIKMGVTDYVLKEKMYQVTPKIRRALKEAADRKQRDEAERQLQKIMDLSLDVICTLNQQGRFLIVSAASKAVWGYAPEDLIGTQVLDLVHPQDKEKTSQALAGLVKGQALINFENRLIRPDGREVVLFWSARWDAQEQEGYFVARDATTIKQAEEKLKRNEQHFRTLLQNSTDGFTLIAADGTVIERSASAQKVTGFGPLKEPEKMRMDLVHPEDLAMVQETFDQVKSKPGSIQTIVYRLQAPDGHYRWVENTLNNQLHTPAVEAIIFNYRDITERKLAEIALQASEARLKQAQEVGQMGSWEMDWKTGSVIWSDEMYRLLGVAKEVVSPAVDTFFSLVHPDDLNNVYQRWEKAVATLHNEAMSFRIVRPDGQVRYMGGVGHFEFDTKGIPLKFFGILQDITASKKAKRALRKSEQKYRNLFDMSPVPMWTFDQDTFQFLDVNKAAVDHYGYSKEEFLSMTLWDIRPQEEHSRMRAITESLKVKAEEVIKQTFKQVKKNGEWIDVDITSSLVDVGGKKARTVIAIDISERMKYVQAIEEQNTRLREIAWTQSHVVRAPLARLLGLLDLMEEYITRVEAVVEYFNLATAAARQLDNIIRDIVRKTEQVKD